MKRLTEAIPNRLVNNYIWNSEDFKGKFDYCLFYDLLFKLSVAFNTHLDMTILGDNMGSFIQKTWETQLRFDNRTFLKTRGGEKMKFVDGSERCEYVIVFKQKKNIKMWALYSPHFFNIFFIFYYLIIFLIFLLFLQH